MFSRFFNRNLQKPELFSTKRLSKSKQQTICCFITTFGQKLFYRKVLLQKKNLDINKPVQSISDQYSSNPFKQSKSNLVLRTFNYRGR